MTLCNRRARRHKFTESTRIEYSPFSKAYFHTEASATDSHQDHAPVISASDETKSAVARGTLKESKNALNGPSSTVRWRNPGHLYRPLLAQVCRAAR